MKTAKVIGIKYDISDEDVVNFGIDVLHMSIDEIDEHYDEVEEKFYKKSKLKSNMKLSVEDEITEDDIVDIISEKTGFLINSVDEVIFSK